MTLAHQQCWDQESWNTSSTASPHLRHSFCSSFFKYIYKKIIISWCHYGSITSLIGKKIFLPSSGSAPKCNGFFLGQVNSPSPSLSSYFCWTSSRDVCVILQTALKKEKIIFKKNHKQKLRKDSPSFLAHVICVKTLLPVECDDCGATVIRAACNCRTARHVWTNLPVIACRWWCFSSIHWWSRLKQDGFFLSLTRMVLRQHRNLGSVRQDESRNASHCNNACVLSRLTPLMLKGCSNSFSFVQWLA